MLMHHSLSMLDSRMSEGRGDQIMSAATAFSQDSKGFFMTDPAAGYVHAMQKKNTVKELLKLRRQAYEQKWKCTQEESNMKTACKFAKLEHFASDACPHILDPCAPADPCTPTHFLPAPPESGHSTQEHMKHPSLQRSAAPSADVNMSLFHWQIKQEAQKLEGVPPELLSSQDADGDTFLHIAVAQGRRALVYVLAAKMAACGCLDMKEHNGQTALHIAAATNQHLIMQDLLAHGAQVNTRDLWGRSPLHVCAEKGHYLSLQSIWQSLSGGGQPLDVELFSYDGLTPLHTAVMSHNGAIKEQRCLENPCSYVTGEMVQKRRMFVECIKTLLIMGASYGAKDLKSGRTCLHMAAEEANVELLHLFLDQPTMLSIVNVKTFSGNTALHISSSLQNQHSQVEAVKLLMRRGANPGARNFENELPSQLVPEGPVGEKVRQILKGKYVHA